MKKITLELTIDEVIMLQELSSDVDCGSEWQDEIAKGLNQKAMHAYRKTVLTECEYNRLVLLKKEQNPEWPKGSAVQQAIADLEMEGLRFYYRIGGDEM